MKEKVNVDIEITGLEELLNITREIHECVRKASSLKRELAKACDNVYIELKDLSNPKQSQASQPTLSSGWAKLVVENQLTHEQYVTITPDDVVTSRPEIIVRLTPAYADDE